MAEEEVVVVEELSETITDSAMDIETPNPNVSEETNPNGELNGDSNSKREREDGGEEDDGASKKQKVDKSVEEQRLENLEESEATEEEKKSGPVSVGPKSFGSSVEMFDYFYKFLHYWPPNLNLNKYEHMVLLDLLQKGHPEPDKKIGGGIHAFQVRYHPMWKSRCFFLVRDDESVDDFSFRKCVDHILPLPENMKVKSDVNKALGGGSGGRGGKGGGGGRGGGRGRGRGRGGKWRN